MIDDSAQVEVRVGLKPGGQLFLNPPVGLSDGMRVTTTSQAADNTAVRTAER